MPSHDVPRGMRARALAALLWALLGIAVITVVMMTWHPWVIGERRNCPAGQRAGWDGHCRPE